MNQVFKPIMSLCQPFIDKKQQSGKSVPMQQIISQALVRVAHAIDTKFDQQQDLIEKLEHRIMLLKRDFGTKVNSQVQKRQAEIEATL